MTTFGLKNYAQNYLKDYELKSTLAVVDGTQISVFIGSEKSGDKRLGGDSKKIYNETYRYFDRLKKCNIIPIVVKGSRPNDTKWILMESRRNCSILSGEKYKKNGFKFEGVAFPTFASKVFYDALDDLEICYCSSDLEVNEDVMELSRKLKCPVISSSYKYCLCDGVTFIPWESIEFEKNLNELFVRCKVFDRESFSGGVPPSIIPYLSIIFSRAVWYRYIFDEILPEFKDVYDINVKYKLILRWLEENGENVCKRKINEIFKKKERNPKEKIELLVKKYVNPTTAIIPTIMKNEEIKPFIENLNFNTRQAFAFATRYRIPSEIIDLVRKSRLPGVFLDMYIDKEYRCKINPVEDMDEESIYIPAIRLIEGIYGLLVRNSNEKTVITLRLRNGKSSENDKIDIYPLNLPRGELTYDQKIEILHNIMKLAHDEKIKSFFGDWHIFVLAFKFWENQCGSRIDKTHIHSVLLTAFMLHVIKKNRNGKKCNEKDAILKYFNNLKKEDYESALNKIKTFVTETQHEVELTDIHHIHMYLTFQACLYHTIQIFTLLDLPDTIRTSDFISGSFYHSIYTELDLEMRRTGGIRNWFNGCESLRSLYCSIVKIIN